MIQNAGLGPWIAESQLQESVPKHEQHHEPFGFVSFEPRFFAEKLIRASFVFLLVSLDVCAGRILLFLNVVRENRLSETKIGLREVLVEVTILE